LDFSAIRYRDRDSVAIIISLKRKKYQPPFRHGKGPGRYGPIVLSPVQKLQDQVGDLIRLVEGQIMDAAFYSHDPGLRQVLFQVL
jgi:hypothetical protein